MFSAPPFNIFANLHPCYVCMWSTGPTRPNLVTHLDQTKAGERERERELVHPRILSAGKVYLWAGKKIGLILSHSRAQGTLRHATNSQWPTCLYHWLATQAYRSLLSSQIQNGAKQQKAMESIPSRNNTIGGV